MGPLLESLIPLKFKNGSPHGTLKYPPRKWVPLGVPEWVPPNLRPTLGKMGPLGSMKMGPL